MEATILEKPTKKTRAVRKPQGLQRIPMSFDRFSDWNPKDGFKYEWKNGFAVKNGSKLKNTEMYIVINISRKFNSSKYYQNGDALVPETRCNLNENTIRTPDIAFFTKEQIKISTSGGHPIPSLVIEIISKNENTIETEIKVKEYFDAGVEVVWQVFPFLKQVWVFTNYKTVSIFTDIELCQAGKTLSDFSLTVDEIFSLE
ncbi:MAG: Uma2 family endonuclease [Cytophagales bacterium]